VAVDTPDPHTVMIHLGKRYPLFLQTIARAECGGTDISKPDWGGSDDKFRAPIDTGPFMFWLVEAKSIHSAAAFSPVLFPSGLRENLRCIGLRPPPCWLQRQLQGQRQQYTVRPSGNFIPSRPCGRDLGLRAYADIPRTRK